MNKIICEAKNIGTLCSDEKTTKPMCAKHERILNVWLGSGGHMLCLNPEISIQKRSQFFQDDINHVDVDMNLDFSIKINEEKLHEAFIKEFHRRLYD